MSIKERNTITIETCCGSLEDAILSQAAGANRIELNSSLFQGGLTPSAGTLYQVLKEIQIPVMAMIRPRGGGFCYTPEEFRCMVEDIRVFKKMGVQGLVFGILKEDGTVDIERNALLLEECSGMETVFHRAIDVVPDRKIALEELISLGFTRILTTAGAPDVMEVLPEMKQMIKQASGRIQILAGGAQPHTVDHIIAECGCDQLHIARFVPRNDSSCAAGQRIFFGGALYPPEDRYEILDRRFIEAFRNTGK